MAAKVLIVDDDHRIVSLLARLLSRHGYEVLVADNGVDAYNTTVAERPALVISDVLLPRMNGFELLQRLKANEQTATVPVLLVSAVYRSQRYLAESKQLGAVGMLAKPFDASRFLETVTELVPPPNRCPNPDEVFRRQLEQAQISFARDLPTAIKTLEQLWRALQGGDLAAADEMLRYLHRLNGTGATLGFTRVAERAKQLHETLTAMVAAQRPPSPDEVAGLTGMVQELAQVQGERPDPKRLQSLQSLTQESGQTTQPEQTVDSRRVVYVVDEDAAVTRHLALQLEGSGYTVRCFSTPTELRAAVAESPPAVVLIDLLLPAGDLSGWAVVRDVREQLGRDTRIAFMSARADLEARLQAVRAGGAGYFTKPLDTGALTRELDRFTETDLGSYRVLIVEDDRASAMLYAATLQQAGIETTTVSDPLRIMGPLVDFQPDLILLDMYMPSCTGAELAAVIRQEHAFLATPILLLSAEEDQDRQLQAMAMGADGFLHKSILPDQLAVTVRSRIARARAVRSLIERDGLTGLLCRTSFLQRLKAEIERARRLKTTVGMALLDIDLLRQINETQGYLSGDRVIKVLASSTKTHLRMTDLVGRLGGDELAIIMTAADERQVVARLDEMRSHFAGTLQLGQDGPFHVTFCCGVASFPRYPSATALLDAVSTALAQAKARGGNLIVLARGPEATTEPS